jgi:hypothetical protein
VCVNARSLAHTYRLISRTHDYARINLCDALAPTGQHASRRFADSPIPDSRKDIFFAPLLAGLANRECDPSLLSLKLRARALMNEDDAKVAGTIIVMNDRNR